MFELWSTSGGIREAFLRLARSAQPFIRETKAFGVLCNEQRRMIDIVVDVRGYVIPRVEASLRGKAAQQP